jgi:hypothetical protein
MPLEEVSDKAKFFLSPQIKHIENTYGNNFTYDDKASAVGTESMAYSIAIAEELSEYRLQPYQWMQCLLGIFGKDYNNLFIYLFDNVILMESIFDRQVEDARELAKNDVRSGMLYCSNYLVTHADGLHHFNGDLELIYREVIAYGKANKDGRRPLTESFDQ